MRVGVVGSGYWGSKLARVACDVLGARRVVVFDELSAAADAVAAAHPGVRCAGSFSELLGAVDAVVVATPPSTHRAVAVAALRAGRHVLVEKPLATTVEDGLAIVDAADASGCTLMVGHTYDFNAAVWALHDIVRAGDVGRVLHVDAARLNLGPVRRDVNVVVDLAPHDVSVLTLVLDDLPTAVSGWATAATHPSIADYAALHLHFERRGVDALVRVSWLEPCKVRRTTVVGDRLMAVYNDLAVDAPITLYDEGIEEAEDYSSLSYRRGGVTIVPVAVPEPLRVEFEHFVDCVEHGRTPLSDGRRGLGIVRVIDAADRATRTGSTCAVEWGDDDIAALPTTRRHAVTP